MKSKIVQDMYKKTFAWTVLAMAFSFPAISSDASNTKKPLCSQLVQRCVKLGQLPAEDGQCYFPFSRGPCKRQGYWFVLSAQESSASGQLKGACVRRPCKRSEALHKDRCALVSKASVEMCSNGPVHVDLEGNLRCGVISKWRTLFNNALPCNMENDTLLNIVKPTSSSQGITPQMDHPSNYPRGFDGMCSSLVSHCVMHGELPYPAHDRCYEPLSRGPCKNDDFWFVYSSQESQAGGQLTGICVRRPCFPGRYGYKGRCVSAEEASEKMCDGNPVHPDIRGHFRCGELKAWDFYLYNALPCRPLMYPQFTANVAGLLKGYSNNEEVVPEVSHRSTNRNGPLDIED